MAAGIDAAGESETGIAEVRISRDPRVAGALAPIHPDTPAGTADRAGDRFTALKAEIDRFANGQFEPNERGEVDDDAVLRAWRRIADIAQDILTAEAKSWSAAAPLTVALFRAEGYAGLAVGTSILYGLTRDFWAEAEPVLPKRARSRANQIDWMVSMLLGSGVDSNAALEARAPTGPDVVPLTIALAAVEATDTVFQARLGDKGGTLWRLIDPLRKARAAAAAQPGAEEAERAEAEAAAAADGAAARSTPDAGLASDTGASDTGTSGDRGADGTAGGPTTAADHPVGLDDPRIARALAPVSADAPGGAEDRYSDAFVRMTAEFDRFASGMFEPNERGEVDARSVEAAWRNVAEAGQEILERESKSFEPAARMMVALFRLEGFHGLAVGLQILSGLVGTYWDTGFPKLPRGLRGRANALDWAINELMGTGSGTYQQIELSSRSPTAADEPALRAAIAAAEDLTGRLGTLAGDRAPKFWRLDGSLKDALRQADAAAAAAQERQGSAAETGAADAGGQTDAKATDEAAADDSPSTEPRTETAASAEQQTAAAARPASAAATPKPDALTPPDVKGAEDLPRLFGQLCSSMVQWVNQVAPVAPTDPRLFQLRRFALWGRLPGPPVIENGKTQVPPPTQMDRDNVNRMAQADPNPAVLTQAEGMATSQPYWLDPHRVVATLLGRAGGDYARAQAAVETGLASFLRQLPGIEAQKFEDGTPFADGATRDWIRDTVLAGDGGSGPPDPVDEGLAAARAAWTEGDGEVAFAVLTRGLRDSSGRASVRWKLAQARFCQDIGKTDLARRQMALIDGELVADGLEAWDPDLAVEALTLYLGLLPKPPAAQPGAPQAVASDQQKAAAAADAELRATLITRLSRLDLAAATTFDL